MKRAAFFALFILLALPSLSGANDNSQATLGDIKEAVYKLILINKKRSKIDNFLNERADDKYDKFINSYVNDNKNILVQIKQGEK